MERVIDLTGRKYGRLTVLRRVENRGRATCWECICECGNTSIVSTGSLGSGKSKSCGCLRADVCRPLGIASRRHGLSKTRIYNAWSNMLKRCTNPDNYQYSNYGGRGITVCEEWETFEGFLEDMQDSYSDGLTLDRLDNDKGYCKENCRWATIQEQANNKRNNTIVEIDGKKETLTDALKRYNVTRAQYYHRVRNGWSPKDALTKPVRVLPKRKKSV